MTTITTTGFRIHVISPEELEKVREGGDASARPAEHLLAEGGEPLRCCLRDARPGEEMILFGYEPVIPPSPYREIGAVLAHARACAGPVSTDRYPEDWYGRPQVLRAYDHRGWIHDTTRVHDGRDPQAVIAEMLSHPDVVRIHSRNVSYGCYMFEITRPD
ncbi:DUF1203 domain-containing protein [Sphaerisporangium sp. NPDC088356]|uniref:DUF1203 domain-containing protein n=1 Tax=Sphaerisporangium sp. NPDC088356 TaxID=3154871 RepID=UPI00342F0D90